MNIKMILCCDKPLMWLYLCYHF